MNVLDLQGLVLGASIRILRSWKNIQWLWGGPWYFLERLSVVDVCAAQGVVAPTNTNWHSFIVGAGQSIAFSNLRHTLIAPQRGLAKDIRGSRNECVFCGAHDQLQHPSLGGVKSCSERVKYGYGGNYLWSAPGALGNRWQSPSCSNGLVGYTDQLQQSIGFALGKGGWVRSKAFSLMAVGFFL